jgi:RNA polymerase sigma-70 factor (ECF subfamily)
MNGDQSTHLQELLDRLRQGDDAARQELVGCAYERLRLLARKIFHGDFPRLKNLHETDSFLHEAVVRLLQALQQVQPPTVADFFTFAAAQVRRVLVDTARREDRRGRAAGHGGVIQATSSQDLCRDELADTAHGPATLAVWAEFHQKVEELPREERDVVDLHWYQGLTQAETARLLGVHEKVVSRRWISARLKLADWVPGLEGFSQDGG